MTFTPQDGGYTPPMVSIAHSGNQACCVTDEPFEVPEHTTIAGLDLSLTSSGLGFIDSTGSARALSVGMRGKATDTLGQRAMRLSVTSGAILTHIKDAGASQVIIEAPAPSRGAASGTWDRAGLWWLVVTDLADLGIPVHSVYPGTVKRWITGNGKAEKNVVGVHVGRLFPDVELKTDDEADALAMAHMLAWVLGFGVPERHHHTLEALKAVKWAHGSPPLR